MRKVLVTSFFALVFPTGVMAWVPSSSSSHRNTYRMSSSLKSSSATTTSEEEESVTTTTTTTNTMFDDFLNEQELLEQSTFPIEPEELMERAKYVLGPECGIGTLDDGKCLAEEFEFIAAVVGPIPRTGYLDALTNFDLGASFTIHSNYFGMSVDPMQPNRVWFLNRVRGIHDKGEFLGAPPTNKEIVYPPQTLHLDFNEHGDVTEFGFYTSDRRQGNTGGLGGAFGFMYGVGKPLPIPECQPYTPSKRFRLLQYVGNLAEKFQKKKKKE
mmetsp:Transcript_1799/g.2081  ORF Transcript_1799/g.2081 Transcript_1799/m.2081 type:complete len:270 (-) Transcript_1799:46-855(-)